MITNLKSQSNLSGLYVVYEGSTNIEKKGNFGISHLMEHLMCKTFFHMIQDFDRDGIEWNAYTSSNEIVFYMQSQAHQLNLSRKLFNDYDPIGLREDLEKLKFMDCLNFYELQYSKPTKIIHVSKNKKLKNLDIDFSDLKIDKKFEIGKHDVPLELNNEFKDKTSIICLSPLIEEDHAYIHFLNAMISLGLKSPLYDEIREISIQ